MSPRAHPLVAHLFAAMKAADVTQQSVALEGGLSSSTLPGWRTAAFAPSLRAFAAACDCVGLGLLAEPSEPPYAWHEMPRLRMFVPVARLFGHMGSAEITMWAVERRAGFGARAMAGWRNGAVPDLLNLEAACDVVGLSLRLVQRSEVEARVERRARGAGPPITMMEE